MLNVKKELLKRKVILYVEDDVSTAEEVGFFLKAYVKDLHIANNGAEGLKLFKSNPIDLVLTDIQMPVMDGLRMIQEIKSINSNVPIMITTAFNETNYLIDALNMGVNKYALKPINLKDILKTIEILLEEFDTLDYTYYLDIDANVLNISQELLDYLGYSKDEVIGHFGLNFVKEEDVLRIKNQFEILKSGVGVKNIYFSIKKKNGAYVETFVNATPVFDNQGVITKIYSELKSIETYMKSEKKLQRAFEKEHYLRELITIDSKIAQIITYEISKYAFLNRAINIIKENGGYEFAFISLKQSENSFKVLAQTEHKSLNMKDILGEEFDIAKTKNTICNGYENVINNNINIIYDLEKMPQFQNKEKFVVAGISSIVALPIFSIYKKNIIGLVSIFFSKIHTLSKDEIDMYKNIVETISLGIETIDMKVEKEELIKKLELEASTDQLTKAINRRRAFNILIQEIERSSRHDNRLSLIYLDIDDFKAINDNYGHEEGDKALVSLTNIIQSMIRVSDTFARWGGEEFIVILPETDLHGATKMAEKFRETIALHEKFTASFGVSEYKKGQTIDDFIMHADKNMYKAKMSGKDRVIYG